MNWLRRTYRWSCWDRIRFVWRNAAWFLAWLLVALITCALLDLAMC